MSGERGATERVVADGAWTRVVPLLLGALLCVLFLLAELGRFNGRLGLPLDDSWIHLQFARNLAVGDGLSYNPGELVSGSTAPLWTAILSLLFLLPGNPVLWAKIAGIGFYLASIDVTRRLAKELGLGAAWAALAAGLTAATGWLVWSALSGMEVTLFIFLSLSGILLHIRERRDSKRRPVSLFILGAAVLARPEGALLVALALADRTFIPVRDDEDGLVIETPVFGPLVWGAVVAGIIIASAVLFNLIAMGSALPTTFAAKAGGVDRYLPDLQAVFKTLGIFFREHPVLALSSVAGCLYLVERLGKRERVGLLPALWLIALPLAHSTMGSAGEGVMAGSFGRYYFPLFPLLVILGLLGVERAGRSLGWAVRIGGARVPLGVLLLAVLIWSGATSSVRGLGRHLQSVANVEQSDVAIAHWLAGRVDPDALLAVNDVGAIKYFLPNRVLDLAGIIHPEVIDYVNAERSRGNDFHQGVLRLLEERQPDFLVIFPAWFPRLTELDPRYRMSHLIEVPHNITMGADTIGIFTTPWTRYPLAEAAGDIEPFGN